MRKTHIIVLDNNRAVTLPKNGAQIISEEKNLRSPYVPWLLVNYSLLPMFFKSSAKS